MPLGFAPPQFWNKKMNCACRYRSCSPLLSFKISGTFDLAQHVFVFFTKPPLLQESRLISSGSPNLVILVEGKVPVESFMGAANSYHTTNSWSRLVLAAIAPNLLCSRLSTLQGRLNLVSLCLNWKLSKQQDILSVASKCRTSAKKSQYKYGLHQYLRKA